MTDIFDDLDPDFPPEEEHDYDKAVSEVEVETYDQIARGWTIWHR